ncbi:MAG: hypothetical protein M3Q75_02125 [Gemmatimonadota bacterium]|nr:hypothetical protein [Gemmatimonadota bacterium]
MNRMPTPVSRHAEPTPYERELSVSRTLRRVLAASVLALVLIPTVAANAADTPSPADPVFPRGLPFAYYEDGCAGAKRCVWNSQEQGDKKGEYSALLTHFRGDYLVKRITNERAARLTDAWCARPRVTCDGYFD